MDEMIKCAEGTESGVRWTREYNNEEKRGEK